MSPPLRSVHAGMTTTMSPTYLLTTMPRRLRRRLQLLLHQDQLQVRLHSHHSIMGVMETMGSQGVTHLHRRIPHSQRRLRRRLHLNRQELLLVRPRLADMAPYRAHRHHLPRHAQWHLPTPLCSKKRSFLFLRSYHPLLPSPIVRTFLPSLVLHPSYHLHRPSHLPLHLRHNLPLALRLVLRHKLSR